MNEDQINDGLREQIARAETPEEVTNLLAKAGTFTQASERTRRAWKNTAARRLDELTGGGSAIQKEVRGQPSLTVSEMASEVRSAITETKSQRLHRGYGGVAISTGGLK